MAVEVIDYSEVGNRLEAVVPHIGMFYICFILLHGYFIALLNFRSPFSGAHFHYGRQRSLPGRLWAPSPVQSEQITADKQHAEHSRE